MSDETRSTGSGGKAAPPIDAAGWLAGAERHPSPHYNDRPEGTPIDLLVIHNISLPPGEFGGSAVDDLFLGRLDPAAHPYFAIACAAGPVSTHLLIRRDGHLIQYVSFNRRAWHAGRSCFEGRERCNDFSIGIELEGTDAVPFEPIQYQVLARCTRAILAHYPAITPERITGHSDIAPGRKTDPGPYFDWGLYRELIHPLRHAPGNERGRVTARVPLKVQETLELAASLVGSTVNQFIVQTALREAERLIEQERMIQLSERDARAFLDALDHPPPLNAELSAALQDYAAQYDDQTGAIDWSPRPKRI